MLLTGIEIQKEDQNRECVLSEYLTTQLKKLSRNTCDIADCKVGTLAAVGAERFTIAWSLRASMKFSLKGNSAEI